MKWLTHGREPTGCPDAVGATGLQTELRDIAENNQAAARGLNDAVLEAAQRLGVRRASAAPGLMSRSGIAFGR